MSFTGSPASDKCRYFLEPPASAKDTPPQVSCFYFLAAGKYGRRIVPEDCIMKRLLIFLSPCALVFCFSSCESTGSASTAQAPAPVSPSPAQEPATPAVKPYPLKKCLVTGEGLMSKGHTITEVYKGQEVKFCCEPCQQAFHMSPGFYMAKL